MNPCTSLRRGRHPGLLLVTILAAAASNASDGACRECSAGDYFGLCE